MSIFTYSLIQRITEPRRFLQVLAGARQVGKTTLARQMMTAFAGKHDLRHSRWSLIRGRYLDRAAMGGSAFSLPGNSTLAARSG
jgi:hypothetical protein